MPTPNRDRRDQLRAKVALGALFLLFSYVVYQAATVFAWDGRWLLAIFAFLSIFFTAISLAGFRYSHRLVRRGFWAAAYWGGWLGVFFGAAILFDLMENVSLWADGVILPATAGFVSVAAAIGVIAYGTWQGTRVNTSRITISIASLPEFWHGKQIVFVSDLHLGNVHDEKFTRKVVGQINAQKPEAIFIGGDMYDGVAGRATELAAPLRDLHAPLGVYFVTGNHEYASHEIQKFFDAIQNANVKILKNEKVDLRGLSLIGVDYRDTKNPVDLDAVLRDLAIDRSQPSILLKHVPEHFDIVTRHGVSLVLSGHTHNGQIWPMNYCGALFKEFYYGHHRIGGTQIYVSSGVGTQGAPFRLGTKSEIVAITLEKA
jgi:hypothetical protein